MACANGHYNEPNQRYCGTCGALLGDGSDTHESETDARSTWDVLRLIAAAGGVILAIGTLLPWIAGYSPVNRREVTLNAVQYDGYTGVMFLLGGALIVFLVFRDQEVGAAIAGVLLGIWLLTLWGQLNPPRASIQWGWFVSLLGAAMASIAASLHANGHRI